MNPGSAGADPAGSSTPIAAPGHRRVALTVGRPLPVGAERTLRAALVCMPFASARSPPIQIGVLAAGARRFGFGVDALHLHLELAARLGIERYESLCRHRGRLLGEWLFSIEAFGADAPDADGRFLGAFPDDVERAGVGSAAELRRVRRIEIPAYLDALVDSVDWSAYDVVGFTSTFQQNVASVALARRLKAVHPGLTVVFGGSNLDGSMGPELVRSVGCIDLAIAGEADRALPRLLDHLERGIDVAGIPGVISRRPDGTVTVTEPEPPFDAMDELPPPDYDDYFVRAEALGLLATEGRRLIGIPFESSRGCWWGAKRHCTFCGLNGSTMTYRRKSASTVARELAHLNARYRVFEFDAVDNILEPSFVTDLFQALEADQLDYRFFYEVKADLSRQDIAALVRGGVRAIQPGIESLDSHVLALMKKGTRASQNINVLRWARYHRLDVRWNLLFGFPHERAEDYARQVAMLPSLVHLQPPVAAGPVWFERFSPLFRDRDAYPARTMVPEASYAYAYPASVRLDDLAYFFEGELDDTLDGSVYEPLTAAANAWKQAWEADPTPSLTLWRGPELIQIDDHRDLERAGTHTFEGPLAAIYLAVMEDALAPARVREVTGLAHPVEEIEAALDEFVERGLMIRDGRLFLSLALPGIAHR